MRSDAQSSLLMHSPQTRGVRQPYVFSAPSSCSRFPASSSVASALQVQPPLESLPPPVLCSAAERARDSSRGQNDSAAHRLRCSDLVA